MSIKEQIKGIAEMRANQEKVRRLINDQAKAIGELPSLRLEGRANAAAWVELYWPKEFGIYPAAICLSRETESLTPQEAQRLGAWLSQVSKEMLDENEENSKDGGHKKSDGPKGKGIFYDSGGPAYKNKET